MNQELATLLHEQAPDAVIFAGTEWFSVLVTVRARGRSAGALLILLSITALLY